MIKYFQYYFKIFFGYAKLYFFLPELRLFWIFLFVILAVSFLNIWLLPSIWAGTIFGFFVVTGAIIFNSGLRLAKYNLEIKIERNQLNNIINSLKDGVIAYDSNFKILIFNKAAEQIFDVSNQEIIGKVMDPSFIQKPRYKLLSQAMFPSLAPIMTRIPSKDDTIQISDITFENGDLELRLINSRIVDSNGVLLGFLKIARDRTREKQAIKAKSEFITIVAHQLRTPLTGINWTFETLAKAPALSADLNQMVKDGLMAAQRLLRVVNDLLDVAKIEEGHFGYQFEDVNLIEFIYDIAASVAVLANEYKVAVYFEKPLDSSIIVKADPIKLKMILSNLIDNAVKYNIANGKVTISLERMKNKSFVQIAVKDTGIGIPAGELDKIFTKFYRGSNAVHMETTGSGLGLYIAKNIIKRHGGEIKAESVEGRGTTFYFTLPTDSKLIPFKEIIYEEE